MIVNSIAPAKLTLAEVQARLAGKKGKRFWTSLDDLAEDPGFEAMLREEFPRQASELTDGVSRRSFMKVMGASLALAGMTGCTKQPDEVIYPYVKQPEDLVLGKSMYFASAYPFPTGAVPVLVKTDAFRPIKVDGNPEHPMSKGKTDLFTQASLLDLYDPDRSQHTVRHIAGQSVNAEFDEFASKFLDAVKETGDGKGVYFLSETVVSPTLAAQWKQIQAKFPAAKLVQYDAINMDGARIASKAAFGEYVDAQYKLEDVDVILSLDGDFLSSNAFPGFLPLSRAYAERHRYEPGKEMNRLYVVECMPTVTGFKAEHRLGLKPSEIDAFATGLATGSSTLESESAKQFMAAVLEDLKKAKTAVVIAGPQSSAAIHMAAYSLNASLGSIGKSVIYTQTVAELPTEQASELKSLVADMNAGKVKSLVILGGNPVYSTPVDLEFGQALTKVPMSAHLSQYQDETSVSTTWHVNQAHYLESWSDVRSYDGMISLVQPMIAPLYGGQTVHNVLQVLLDNPEATSYDAVAATAKTYIQGDFEQGWKKALHDGWVEGTAFVAKTSAPKLAAMISTAPASTGGYEINFKSDASIYDGRFGNNGWLQELPKQVTHLSWDNAALMSLETMAALKVEETDLIELEMNGRKLTVPPLLSPGHPDGAITVHLGMGRNFGRVGQDVGANAYLLRTSDMIQSTVQARKTEGKHDLCVTSVHSLETRGKMAQRDLEHPELTGAHSLAGHEAMERNIIRYATLAEVKAKPGFANEGERREAPAQDMSLFPDAWHYDAKDKSSGELQNKWGMAIDLNSCTGCNACVVSCYAENNISVVGREQVKIGRNMQWLRIDTYFEGDLHAPRAHFQPMLCQHCENAGCEQVCPVGATVHTPEGINTMVYNRCVGTRYCSNNCPYKVRRFNFLLYSDYETESLKLMRNPDVTVRSRGVMEKCTYCMQRIQSAKITADKEGRGIRDGEVVTACQQACPTDAITFGNMNDPKSKVIRQKNEERNYAVLGDLNYRPRTTYVAGVINPNPALEQA